MLAAASLAISRNRTRNLRGEKVSASPTISLKRSIRCSTSSSSLLSTTSVEVGLVNECLSCPFVIALLSGGKKSSYGLEYRRIMEFWARLDGRSASCFYVYPSSIFSYYIANWSNCPHTSHLTTNKTNISISSSTNGWRGLTFSSITYPRGL